MTADASKGFFLSALLHGGLVALLFLGAFIARQRQPEMVTMFELVAGEGDNYGAKVAAALGTENGLKINVPVPPAPKPEPEPAPPEPAAVEPAPVVAAPPPKSPPKAAPKEEPVPNFAKQVRREVIKAESKAKRDIAKQRAAEKKRQQEEARQMTKAEFDAKHKVASSAPAKKSSAPKVQHINAEGIRKGVAGGSTENKIGGQGGKALRSDNTEVMDVFFAMFKDRVRKNFEPPPGLSDQLEVKIEIMSHANGTFSGAKIVKSSGSKEFDDAVMAAAKRVQMSARPDHKSSSIIFTFAMKDLEQG